MLVVSIKHDQQLLLVLCEELYVLHRVLTKNESYMSYFLLNELSGSC